ncbi:MAG: ATP-binding protein [Chloroflexota bacterium]|nr:ATP-binding protein [Chloroflexota bacterium]
MKTFNIRKTLSDFIGLNQVEETEATIQNWREITFQVMLNIFVLIGFVAYPITVSSLIQGKEWKTFALSSMSFIILLIIRFAINRKFYKPRVISFLATIYFLGISLGISKTLIGDGRIWLMFLIIMSEVLLGGKTSLIILVITTISWYGLGILFQCGILPYPHSHLLSLINPDILFPWKNTSTILFMTGLILIVSIRAITHNLNKALNQSRALAKTLRKEIEERKQTEYDLRNSEQRYRGLFENSPLLIVEIDEAFNILAINSAMAKSLGYAIETIVGSHLSNVLPRPIYEKRVKLIKEAITTNQIIYSNDERNGRYFYNIFVPSPKGETLQVISQNITEQEQDKQKILNYQEHLNDLVRARTDDLFREIEERKQAEQKAMKAQKMADIGLLATGVAHELNSPLQGILTNSDYLLIKYADEIDETQVLRSKLKSIKQGVLRCGKIVRSLQNYAHTSSSELSPHNIAEIVDDILVLTKHQFRNYDNISIVTEIEENMPPLLCDHDQIMQSLINLLTNARDAMPEGGQITIQGNYCSEKRQFILRVIDTGDGMEKEIYKNLFKPFFTTKPVGKGTGLGLYIVNKIVQSHGGTIDVHSTSGKGTVVTMTYPEELPMGKERAS